MYPGQKTDRSEVSRGKQPDDTKLENELEMVKDNKRKTDTVNDVAGREDKGSLTGLLEKLTPKNDPKDIKVATTGPTK